MVGHREKYCLGFSLLCKRQKKKKGIYFRVPNLRLKKNSVTEKTEIEIKSTKNHRKIALPLLMAGTCIL